MNVEIIVNQKEIEAFLEEWGQTHGEICSNLDYDEKDSDDLLVDEYFFHEKSQLWVNKHNSFFSDRDEKIANYLRYL